MVLVYLKYDIVSNTEVNFNSADSSTITILEIAKGKLRVDDS